MGYQSRNGRVWLELPLGQRRRHVDRLRLACSTREGQTQPTSMNRFRNTNPFSIIQQEVSRIKARSRPLTHRRSTGTGIVFTPAVRSVSRPFDRQCALDLPPATAPQSGASRVLAPAHWPSAQLYRQLTTES